MPARGLDQLKPLKRRLSKAQREAALRAPQPVPAPAPTATPTPAPTIDAAPFLQAVQGARPLPPHGRHLPRIEPAPPRPRQRERDEQAVMREALSDDFDVESLLDTDEHLSWRRPGLGPDVVRRLRRGVWTVQAEIDLHGLRLNEARAALADFLREAHRRGLRCLRVVHGKGLGSPGKAPVIKPRALGWLMQKQEVLAFVQAPPAQGGAGAVLVLLRQA